MIFRKEQYKIFYTKLGLNLAKKQILEKICKLLLKSYNWYNYICRMNNWYEFQNLVESSTVEISIYDEIGDYGTSAKNFIDDLKSAGDKDINIRMN